MDLDSEKMVNLESNENTLVNKINPDEIKIENSKKIEFLPSNSFSKLLQGFVLAAANSNSNFQAKFGMSHQEALGTVTAIAAQTLHQSQTQNESLESSSNPPKSPESDGYNWRKYGQKHVKNSGNSRSYYRCTIPSCCAKKKVQHVDESGKIVEVVYKGNHNHDPPHIVRGLSRKRSFSETSAEKIDDPCREESTQVLLLTYDRQDSQLNSSVAPVQNDVTNVDEQHLKTPDTTRHAIEVSEQPALSMEVEHSKSSNCNGLVLTDTLNECDIPIKKRRLKESNKEGSQPVYRTFKEPKIVVQSAADSGICSDGYRWRKYGQKMVKGNQHPRSYYRCSSAGCPVRKHVERATDDSSAIISMYEGEHDHDKPLPKKQQSSPKSPIFVDAPPTDIVIPNNVLLLKTEENSTPPCRESSAQHHEVSNDGCNEQKSASEPASPPKVLESAQTLVSVGIKPEQGIKLESC